MDQFNYLAVLISIVLGLGITQLLAGFARWLEQRSEVRVYAPSIIWAGTLLIVHVQTWWSMYGMRDHAPWTFLQFSIVLLQPIILFLLATLVLPSAHAHEQDMRSNYFGQRAWFFGMLATLLAVSVLKDLVLEGELIEPLNLGFHVFLFVASAIAMVTSREVFHKVLAYISIGFIFAYIVLLFAELA